MSNRNKMRARKRKIKSGMHEPRIIIKYIQPENWIQTIIKLIKGIFGK